MRTGSGSTFQAWLPRHRGDGTQRVKSASPSELRKTLARGLDNATARGVSFIILSAKDLDEREKRVLESHVSGITHKDSGTLEDIVVELRHVLTQDDYKKVSTTER